MNKRLKLGHAIALALMLCGSAVNAQEAAPASSSMKLTPTERAQWAGQFVQRASQRSTSDGAMATLAQSDTSDVFDTKHDLVYNSLPAPCRIVDTRATSAGPIPTGLSRIFAVRGVPDFSVYGGLAFDCGLSDEYPEAIVVNLTAFPSQSGKAFIQGLALVPSTSISYQALVGPSTNTVEVQLSHNSGDFTIGTTGTSHFVVELVGYYAKPKKPKALECVTATANIAMTASSTNWGTAKCPVGYSLTGGGCNSGGITANDGVINFIPSMSENGFFCRTKNGSVSPQTGVAYAVCCRLTGG